MGFHVSVVLSLTFFSFQENEKHILSYVQHKGVVCVLSYENNYFSQVYNQIKYISNFTRLLRLKHFPFLIDTFYHLFYLHLNCVILVIMAGISVWFILETIHFSLGSIGCIFKPDTVIQSY